mgnify:FL=1
MRILAWPGKESKKHNPYCYLLYSEMAAKGCLVDDFIMSIRKAKTRLITTKYDVFHVHWPEHILYQSSFFSSLFKLHILFSIIFALKCRGTKLVWTVHNLAPHGSVNPFARRLFYRYLLRSVDAVIYLSKESVRLAEAQYEILERKPKVIIPHGHYIGVYPNKMSKEEARTFLGIRQDAFVFLFFGRLMPYKGIEDLITAFKELKSPACVLLIAGESKDNRYARKLKEFVGKHIDFIKLIDRYIPDDEVQVFMKAADIVVLPYRRILNSGTALLALSFGRPVIVPAQGSMRELRDIVGLEWVYVYTPPITGKVLADCIRWGLKQRQSDGPDLSPLNWHVIAEKTYSFFKQLMENGN